MQGGGGQYNCERSGSCKGVKEEKERDNGGEANRTQINEKRGKNECAGKSVKKRKAPSRTHTVKNGKQNKKRAGKVHK